MNKSRILSAIMAIVLVLSTLTFGTISVSATGDTFFVDPVNGNDSAAGTQSAPLKTLKAAANKMTGDATVYLLNSACVAYSGDETFGTPAGTMTVEGVGNDVALAVGISSLDGTAIEAGGYALMLKGDVVFKNIALSTQFWAHVDTCGYMLTYGEGTKFDTAYYSSPIHGVSGSTGFSVNVGPYYTGVTAGEHFIVDAPGGTFDSPLFGAAYTTAGNGIDGDLIIEVLRGTLKSVNIRQAGFNTTSHTGAVITGDVKVKVGSEGAVGDIDATATYYIAYVRGNLHVIVENGGSIGAFKLNNFDKKDYYYIDVVNPEYGDVNHADGTGKFELVPAAGYMAAVTPRGGNTLYYGQSTPTFDIGEYSVEFVPSTLISDNSADVIIDTPEPTQTVWPIRTDSANVVASANITPADAEVAYSKVYTYDVTLTPAQGKSFPADFTFTINGSSDYDIDNLYFSGDLITFTYVGAETAADPDRYLVYYNGGVGVTGTAPEKFYKDPTDNIITIIDNPFTKGGYTFGGFTDGVAVYQPGDEYVLTGNVEFKPVWVEIPTYNVAYVDGGATGGFAPEVDSAAAGEYVEVRENTFSKYGYNFAYWTDAQSNQYKPGDKLLMGNAHITLTANWEVDASAGTLIYVDTENGSSTNSGADINNALDTIKNAVAAAGSSAATIVVKGSTALTTASLEGAIASQLSIVGYDADAEISVSGGVVLSCNTTIKDIRINAANGAYIVSNGNTVVLGPNLHNVGAENGISYVDGAVNATVAGLNTTINEGVTIDTYYVGGANLDSNTKGITGDSLITINGGTIGTFDFAPMGTTAATISNGSFEVYINGGNIKKVAASTQIVAGSVRCFIIFSDGTYSAISGDIMTRLNAGFNTVYVVDSGVGGSIEITNKTNGQSTLTTSTGVVNVDLRGAGSFTTRTTSSQSIRLQGGYIAKLRYGTFINSSVNIEATVGQPSGGALASSVAVSSTYQNAEVSLDNWTPELIDEKLGYKTVYTVDVVLDPDDGYFFDASSLPAVTVNGEAAVVSVDADGLAHAKYTFPRATGRAPKIPVKFSAGSAVGYTGTLPADTEYEHLSTNNTLPNVGITNLGYKFSGWKSSADGAVYLANTPYIMTSEEEVTFTAQWLQRGSSDLPLPNVLIMYDLSEYAKDRGRNPKFESTPIKVENAFANLEYSIFGSKTTKTTTFDYEKDVTVIKSDKGNNAIMINNWELDKAKADPAIYPFLTIVYYYDGTTAVGKRGVCSFGNALLPDGNTSEWYGKTVTSEQEIVGGKWAAITFSFEGLAEEKDIPSGAYARHFQIFPIGDIKCKSLGDETLYLKAMYFSKERPITE